MTESFANCIAFFYVERPQVVPFQEIYLRLWLFSLSLRWCCFESADCSPPMDDGSSFRSIPFQQRSFWNCLKRYRKKFICELFFSSFLFFRYFDRRSDVGQIKMKLKTIKSKADTRALLRLCAKHNRKYVYHILFVCLFRDDIMSGSVFACANVLVRLPLFIPSPAEKCVSDFTFRSSTFHAYFRPNHAQVFAGLFVPIIFFLSFFLNQLSSSWFFCFCFVCFIRWHD